MKAIISTKYGLDKLKIEDVPKPVPGDNQVLIKIRASSVTTQDMVLIAGKPFFVRLMTRSPLRPKTRTPGSDMSGQVEAIGRYIKQFKPGDEVYANLSECGYGSFAEYVCVPENVLALKPTNLSFEEAAAVPEAALVALQGLRDFGKVKKEQKILIYSASGGIGTFAVQFAKYYGAEVTGVCSTRNLDLVRSLGADHVIDYSKEDFTRNGQRYDLIMAVRYTRPVWAIKRALAPGGIYVSTAGPSIPRLFQEFLVGPRIYKNEDKKVEVITTKLSQNDLIFTKELIESGKVRPVIDRSFSLYKTPEALRYYSRGHARGRVIISIGQDSNY